MSDFILDIQDIRSQAAQNLITGAVTDANSAQVRNIIRLLESALATELMCVLRYNQHSVAAAGIHAGPVASHFSEHAADELDHAKRLANRIHQLGGEPSFNPVNLARKSHSQYKECDNLRDMIVENLIAERIAVISYTEMIRFIGDSDPTTRRLLEGILEKEEEHANEMASLLEDQ